MYACLISSKNYVNRGAIPEMVGSSCLLLPVHGNAKTLISLEIWNSPQLFNERI